MREGTLLLPDGRTLSYAEYGDPEGIPFVLCHGTPGSRLDLCDDDDIVRLLGARIIVPDRPGFGHSTFQPNRTLSNWGHDVGQLADALGIDRFVVAGGSGGGPHALACAHELPGRVVACLVFASPAPCDFPGATSGMAFGNRLGLKLSTRGGWLYRKLVERQAQTAIKQPERMIQALMKTVDASDAAILAKPESRTAIARSFKEAYRHGSEGHLVDGKLSLTLAPWSFRLEDIRVPVFIWHGDQDRLVSIEMGKRLAHLIPGSTLKVLPGIGHFVMDHPENVREAADLLATFRGSLTDT